MPAPFMRRVPCLAAVLVAAAAAQVLTAQPGPQTLALVGGRVIPAPDAAPIDDAVVLIGNGRIAAVGSRTRIAIPDGSRVIDCRGLVVVAGFHNSHVHFTEPQWNDAATQPAPALTARLQAMLTSHGFTTVVDTGSLLQNTVALRRRIDAGEVAGPRILTAGLPLYPPDGIPFYLKDGSVPPEVLKRLPQPSTARESQAAVAANIAGGADIIKLFSGSWVERGRVLPMPAPLAAAAAQEAHRHGRPVFSHASSPAGLDVAMSAGVDVIAHALDETAGLTPEHLTRMRQRKMALIPTLTLFAEARDAPAIFKEVGDFAALGGDLLFGTDVGFHQMYDPRLEFASLARAGLSWRQVLASLTTVPARRLEPDRTRGQVAQGLAGDVVVLGGDPALDPLAFTDVRVTVRTGRVIFQRGR